MNDKEITDALRLLLKLWKEGGKGVRKYRSQVAAVEAFLALSEQQHLVMRAEKILPHIQELSNGTTFARGVKTPMITINGEYFEMTRINDWELDPFTVENIWTFDECFLEEFVGDGHFQGSNVILRDGHLVARIPVEDYVPCFDDYLTFLQHQD